MKIEYFIGKVFCEDARRLLGALPTGSVDAVITDTMYGSAKQLMYDWGVDPARGNPVKHWLYHHPMYEQCRRVLKPGGVLAWAQSAKFCEHFPAWFGKDKHRVWTLTRYRQKGRNPTGHTWVVQTREQEPIEFPHRDSLIIHETMYTAQLADAMTLREQKIHPCVKPVEELVFMISSLTKLNDIVLDCFCGLGSTLLAAEKLFRRWIGCDISRRYCQRAMQRLDKMRLAR